MASPRGLLRGSFCPKTLLIFVVVAAFCLSIGYALPTEVTETEPESERRNWLANFLQRGDRESTPGSQQVGDREQSFPRQEKLTDSVREDSEAMRRAFAYLKDNGNSQSGSESHSKRPQVGDSTESPQRYLQATETRYAGSLSEFAKAEQRHRTEFPRGGSDLELELEEREQEAAFDPSLLLDKETEQEQEPLGLRVPYLLGPSVTGWDEQRAEWLDNYPQFKSFSDSKPRVLIVSGSFPLNCRNRIADHIHIKALKQKMDYARMHNYDFYYNFVYMDPLFILYWAKLPLLRKLMLTHPEIEWFFWVDGDALFTDMVFEAPWDTYEDYNLVMWGLMDSLLINKNSNAISDSAFLIRNSQWSLDLIDRWSPFGPDDLRDLYGDMLSAFLTGRMPGAPSDPQSALAYLILTDETVRSKVKLVDSSDYMLNANWVDVRDTFETSISKYHPGLGDWRWPWVTHFRGCHLCSADQDFKFRECLRAYNRALNFADNQVFAYMGFEHESLSSVNITRLINETADQNLGLVGVNPWEKRMAQVTAGA